LCLYIKDISRWCEDMKFILESEQWAQRTSEMILTLEDNLHIFKPPCNFLFITWIIKLFSRNFKFSVNENSLKLQQKSKHTKLNLKSKTLLTNILMHHMKVTVNISLYGFPVSRTQPRPSHKHAKCCTFSYFFVLLLGILP
jgi:hypothetical protein